MLMLMLMLMSILYYLYFALHFAKLELPLQVKSTESTVMCYLLSTIYYLAEASAHQLSSKDQ